MRRFYFLIAILSILITHRLVYASGGAPKLSLQMTDIQAAKMALITSTDTKPQYLQNGAAVAAVDTTKPYCMTLATGFAPASQLNYAISKIENSEPEKGTFEIDVLMDTHSKDEGVTFSIVCLSKVAPMTIDDVKAVLGKVYSVSP